MKALVLESANRFRYEERPMPVCGQEDVLVKVDAVCICGSDVHAIAGRSPLFTYPRVIGHEVAATVQEVGRHVSGFVSGDRVCLMPCISCGHCHACRKGHTNCCSSLRLYGVQTDGGLQEYFTAPASNWLKVSNPNQPAQIAMIEPLTIGAHAVAKLDLEPEDRVLVIGAGPIGVSCALNAKSYGARVTLADTSSERRIFVTDRFGFTVMDPLSEDYAEKIETYSKGELFDAVIDTTANKRSMDTAWRYAAQAGKILFVGISGGMLEIDEAKFHMKEPSLYVTRNSTRRDYERILELCAAGKMRPADLITHSATFAAAAEQIVRWVQPGSGVFKGVVLF